ncbi:MAG: hypothetical protein ACYC61_19645 [Isosphaeraceae bacterium]
MRLPPFDEARQYYPLVMNFAAQMLAFKEIMSMADLKSIRAMMKKVFDASNLEGVPFELIVSSGVDLDGYDLAHPFRKEFRDLLPPSAKQPMGRLLAHTAPFEIVGPRALKCRSQEDGIEFSAEEIASVYLAGPQRQVEALAVSAGSLIVSAYEATRSSRDRGPLWEFFRHCRNAAAHGGRFHLENGEPSRPARWRSMSVERGLQGTPLFAILDDHGLIGLGDAILLLWDVEQLGHGQPGG